MSKTTLTKEKYERLKSFYGFLISLPIILAIVHISGAIFVQNSIDVSQSSYTHSIGLSFNYGLCDFLLAISSKSENITLVKQMPAIIAMIETLIIIFLSSFSFKNFICYKISTLIYIIDFIMLFISLPFNHFALTLAFYDYIINAVIHVIFLALIIFNIFLHKELVNYKNSQPIIIK